MRALSDAPRRPAVALDAPAAQPASRIISAEALRGVAAYSLGALSTQVSTGRNLGPRDLANETARAAYALGRRRGFEQGARTVYAIGRQLIYTAIAISAGLTGLSLEGRGDHARAVALYAIAGVASLLLVLSSIFSRPPRP